MGIKNLYKLINDYAPNANKETSLKKYKNKKIVLDASMIIYQSVIAIRTRGCDLENEGSITTHILGVINKALMLLNNDIIPIFVFDGKAPELKKITLKKRKTIRDKVLIKLKEDDYQNDKEKIKDFKKSYVITEEHTKQLKELLKLFGIPIITSPIEADPLCAYLVKNKYADYVATEDMDLLTFGCPILLRGLSSNKKMNEINLNDILNSLNISYNQFIELCILLGSDYTSQIPKVGYKTALNIIKKYGNIKEFLKNNTKYNIPDNFKYEEAKELFINPKLVPIKEKLILNRPKYDEIENIMVSTYGFNIETVNKYINKLRIYHKKQKGGLYKYFNKSNNKNKSFDKKNLDNINLV